MNTISETGRRELFQRFLRRGQREASTVAPPSVDKSLQVMQKSFSDSLVCSARGSTKEFLDRLEARNTNFPTQVSEDTRHG